MAARPGVEQCFTSAVVLEAPTEELVSPLGHSYTPTLAEC